MYKYHIYTHKYAKHYKTNSWKEATSIYHQQVKAGNMPIFHTLRHALASAV